MVFEQLLFSKLSLPGEDVRLGLALLGLAIGTYYDLGNNKNVPNTFLYAFLALSAAASLVFFNADLVLYSVIQLAVVSMLLFVLYKQGQMGGADVFIILSLILLLPIHPSFIDLPFNYPFVLSAMIFAGLLFAIFSMFFYGTKIMRMKTKPNLLYAALIIPYAIFAYMYVNSFLFSPLYFGIVTIMMVSSIFFMVFRDDMQAMLAEKIPLGKITEEDVLALERMDSETIKKYSLKRIATMDEIARMKKLKLKEVYVYTKLPPFLPFLFAGAVMALFLSKYILQI
jgi:hypothetical protein